MGGGGKGSQNSSAGDWAEAIAMDVYKDTKPIRHGVQGSLADFLGGGFDYTASPAYAPAKSAAEQNYQLATQSALSNLPAGGVLDEAMLQNELAKARTMTDVGGNIGMDMWNKAYGLGSMAPQQTLGGLGTAAQSQAMAQQAQAQQKAGKAGGLGQLGTGAGYLLGGML